MNGSYTVPIGNSRAPKSECESPSAASMMNRLFSAIPSSMCCPAGDCVHCCGDATCETAGLNSCAVRAKIPPGTQGRQKFRLRGKGVKNPRTGETGDHIYTVKIAMPTNRTPAGADAVTLLDSLYEKPVRADLPKGL